MDDLAICTSSNCYINVVKYFRHTFRIRFSFIVYEYGFDLFIRVSLMADNRSNLIPGLFRGVFVFFKIALVLI